MNNCFIRVCFRADKADTFPKEPERSDALYPCPDRHVRAVYVKYNCELDRQSVISTTQETSTDYQERASAFCTGLCMYEERKSYSECFDLCNWHLSQGPNYKVPLKQSSYVGPLSSVLPSTASNPATTAAPTDIDYSNDEPVFTDWPSASASGYTKSTASSDNKRRKGKKPKGNKNTTDKRKRLLKELRRKLLKDIGSKQQELSEKALALEQKIGSLESEIELGKQTIVDFEERLQHIKLEMDKIENLKANITTLIKGSRKLASGKKVRPKQLLPEGFLLPEERFSNENITELLKEFLIKDNRVKRDYSYHLFDPDRTRGGTYADKSWTLGEARNNLESIVTNSLNKEYINELL
ncbi:hypothetical protein LSH36_615g01035 [Paralvinella palmiformis]|uniref:Uncharacterized protein n=1 Tax=Paralvinella palmiformis TaxID=53620 RepID=A0AAD9MW59_9ANNE|nr:hypothetical protein LSH36_615g01035 [Paralvinella palmiformis]